MSYLVLFFAALVFTTASGSASAAGTQTDAGLPVAPVGDIQSTRALASAARIESFSIKSGHPRILLTRDDVQRLEELIGQRESFRSILERFRRDADEVATLERVYERGNNLRSSVHRVMNLALAFRLFGDQRYATKAIDEMLAASAFPDWYDQTKFLNTASHTIAMAIGYDWLYDVLSPEDRRRIERAIVEKGLMPGLEYYAGRGKGAVGDWPEAATNWNLVSNAGMIIGALAVADVEPVLARRVLARAVASISNGLSGYAPEGGWQEGPCYWDYGTLHGVIALAALQSALGTDFGLSSAQGFGETGSFRIHTAGPTGAQFNFGDCGRANARPAPVMLWLARRFNRPEYAQFHAEQFFPLLYSDRKERGRVFGGNTRSYLTIVWLNDWMRPAARTNWRLDARIRGDAEVVTMRESWSDPDAAFAAMLAGTNDRPHGHLDLGSFVFDADGVRWATDAGGRVGGTWYHNTISLNGRSQWHRGTSRVTAFHSSPRRAHAVVDLSNAFGRRSRVSIHRGMALVERSALLIQDEIKNLGRKASLRWTMLTQAEVEVAGRRATLSRDGRRLSAQILSPSWARFVGTRVKDSGQRRIPRRIGDHTLLTISLNGARASGARLAVLLRPLGERRRSIPEPSLRPLASWEGGAFGRTPAAGDRRPEAKPRLFQSDQRDACDSESVFDRILCRAHGGPRR